MLIAPAVLAAIISAVGALGGAAASANKPPPAPPQPKPPMDPDAMTGGSSEMALQGGQKTVADAFPPAGAQAPAPPGGMQMNPEILAMLKQMGGF